MLDVRALVLHYPDLDVGIRTLETSEQIRQVITGHQTGHADDQLPGDLIGALLQAAFGVVHGRQNQVRLTQELVTLMGERHALGVAIEQADADFLLQLLDGQGQGRLGNERGLRGGGDRAGLGNGDEMADLTQGHHGRLTRWAVFIDCLECISIFAKGCAGPGNIWKHTRTQVTGTFELG